MIICLEGPDGAGKTTLAHQLGSMCFMFFNTQVTVLKRGPIQLDPIAEYLEPFVDLVEHHERIMILDRWHVGELIYGPLLRGESKLTVRQANYIEMVMASLGCHFVHLSAPVETLESRWDQNPDDLVKRELLASIRGAYFHYVVDKAHWETWPNGFPTDGTFDVTYTSPFPGRYVGPKEPAVLLLGDRRNDNSLPWPFVPHRATSGHWMLGAFIAGEVDHMRVGIANANEFETCDLNALWQMLQRPPVVTLGRNAERAWRMVDAVEPQAIPHPQYMRRFHHQEFKSYGQLIKAAMR